MPVLSNRSVGPVAKLSFVCYLFSNIAYFIFRTMYILNNEPNVLPIFIGVLHEQLNRIVEVQECDPARRDRLQQKPNRNSTAGYPNNNTLLIQSGTCVRHQGEKSSTAAGSGNGGAKPGRGITGMISSGQTLNPN
jgi:hypothetical protein